jgi:hypothetical protein
MVSLKLSAIALLLPLLANAAAVKIGESINVSKI